MTRQPSYRHHRARNCAVVTIAGRDHYLGTFDSVESWEKYHRLVAEWLSEKNGTPARPVDATSIVFTVNQLILAYWTYAKKYYVKNSEPTSEQDALRHALSFVRRLYGTTSARDFSPKSLKAVREAMITHPIIRTLKVKDPKTGQVTEKHRLLHTGLSRKVINKHVGRIKRMFAWAVEEELLPVTVHQALLRIASLKKGKSNAREKPRIKPVPDEHVEAVLPYLPPTVKAMVQLQRLCGGRPHDIVEMRAIDIDMTGPVWEYRPGPIQDGASKR